MSSRELGGIYFEKKKLKILRNIKINPLFKEVILKYV